MKWNHEPTTSRLCFKTVMLQKAQHTKHFYILLLPISISFLTKSNFIRSKTNIILSKKPDEIICTQKLTQNDMKWFQWLIRTIYLTELREYDDLHWPEFHTNLQNIRSAYLSWFRRFNASKTKCTSFVYGFMTLSTNTFAILDNRRYKYYFCNLF